jgi:ERCC4-type nuclease
MRVIIDNREHGLFEKCEAIISNDTGYATIETQMLPIGDILIKTDEGKDVMIVERKTLTDLLSSIKDGRYEEQSHRLKHASGFPSHNIVYIIEGMLSTLRTVMEKKLIYSAMASLNYFKGFSVIRTSGIQETAETLIYMADKIDRNFMKGIIPSYLLPDSSLPMNNNLKVHSIHGIINNEKSSNFIGQSTESLDCLVESDSIVKNTIFQEKSYSGFVKTVKKDNITKENIGEIMLCQIPGISSVYAQAILKKFLGFSNMLYEIKAGTARFDNIMYETNGKERRIPKTCGIQINTYMQNI